MSSFCEYLFIRATISIEICTALQFGDFVQHLHCTYAPSAASHGRDLSLQWHQLADPLRLLF